ncbi:FAD-dependent oxidoreductase [Yamadazyma tenuis]|uniref:FAD dependent oxidoreductase n=1 Tax=Candida tenuis (strain ATCC 10573 / BCRC 21748 / CBS 615 / JCM 9827 / NBRC 10315 / NRRL Y-1498 / VKM Y-70) TaxID=590646 RepID=G3B0G2_CANTC|nr:FAD dependent oxidoreductase [Yamadazyma tenuis ATCC 10573]EGV65396.1 FAD dependent oxidoreductase [Yamadazyma tenuis ATCC 10573]WEJ94936.1 FAD-dependent oxidoreductase [Yamadazyma tenuis]
MSSPKDKDVLIIGAGTFGLSSGLWLLRNGFKSVTIIDPKPLPSTLSAGYDINKIIQSAYPEDAAFTASLAVEALEGWQNDPVFYPHFYETGIVYATSQGEPSAEYEELESVRNFTKSQNRKHETVLLNSPNEFRAVVPQLTGSLANWKGHYQKTECGWADAKSALVSAGKEFARLGGQYVESEVARLLYNADNTAVLGCVTSDGRKVFAATTIVAAGASSVKIMDFEDQLLAKCWTVGHIRLTPDEAASFKGMPVVCNLEKGFFFEPDYTKNELKICNEFPGYTHYVGDSTAADSSVPVYKNQIPHVAERDIRLLLQETLPQLADRPLVQAKICWCTDTPDRNFLVCEHPQYGETLVLATGDSGHGFKHMPSIGKYVARLVMYGPGGLDCEKRTKWRWRPETAKDRIQDRFGGDGHVNDLKDITDWVSAISIAL